MALEDVMREAINEAREAGLEGDQAGDDFATDDNGNEVVDEDAADNTDDDAGAGDDKGDKDDKSDDDDAAGAGDDDSGEEKTEEQKLAEAATALEAAEAAEAAKKALGADKGDKGGKAKPDLLKELGLKSETDKHGRVHRIPLPRVKNMLDSLSTATETRVKTVVGAIAKALGAKEEDVTEENFGTKLTEVMEELPYLRDRADTMASLAPIMEKNGDAFIQILAKSNPEQYSKFLAVLDPDFKPEVAAELPDEKNDPKPEPDVEYTLADGKKAKTYSQAQHDKYLEWRDRRIERKHQADMTKRLKPYEDKRTAEERAQASREDVIRETNAFLSDAHEWDGFKDSKDAVLAELKNIDTKVPFKKAVRMAYEKVVIGKYKTDYTAMRAKVLAELKKAPPSTSAKKGTGAGKKKDEEIVRGEGGEAVTDSTERAIRQAISRAKAAGLK